jgi:protein-S-isoprenylcysteine O-methyltransferase Ste14
MISGILFILSYLVLLFAIFFLSAGTINIISAWIALGSYAAISIINFFLVDPELVSERMQMGGKGVSQKDRFVAAVSFLFIYPITLIVAGLDVGRYHWTLPFPFVIQIIAMILYILGNLFGRWAMVSNKYFSTFVRIQVDRNHKVQTGGPYRLIRHPGYAGAILAAMALPLAIGSICAIAPALVGCIGFVVRTALEDDVLIDGLKGYRDYSLKVRYRLLPGVW